MKFLDAFGKEIPLTKVCDIPCIIIKSNKPYEAYLTGFFKNQNVIVISYTIYSHVIDSENVRTITSSTTEIMRKNLLGRTKLVLDNIIVTNDVSIF